MFDKFRGNVLNNNIRNGILFAIFSIINSGLNFFLLFILAKNLTIADYGYLNLYNNFITIGAIISSLGTSGYVSVVFFKNQNKLHEYISSISFISFSITCLLLVLILLFGDFKFIGINKYILLCAPVYCFFQYFITLVLDYRRLNERVTSYGYLTIFIALTNFIFTFVFVAKYKEWEIRVFVQLLVALLCFLYSLSVLHSNRLISVKNIKYYCIKEALIFGLPLIPHLLTVWLRQGLDSYIIKYNYDAATVGIYSFAMNFYSIIYILGSAFNNSNSVNIYKILANGYTDETKKLFKNNNKLIIVLFAAITVCTIIFAYVFIPVFFNIYIGSLEYIIPLCIAGFFQIIYLLYVNILYFYEKTKLLMKVTFVLSLIYSLGSFVITKFSLSYLSYWLMLINFTIAITVMLLSKKELNKSYKTINNV